jgi:DHA3 family macrolide efflux protein-like MFS transporter
MQSAAGLGMIPGGVVLSAWGGFKKRIFTSVLGLVMLGVSMIAAGFTPASMFPFFIGAVFVFGLVVGPIVDSFGVQIWYIIAGVVTVVIGFVELLIPAVRSIESQKSSAMTLEPALFTAMR